MIKTQEQAQARIQELEQKLGIKPTFATQADAQARIDELNKSISSMPMSVQEFAEKRRAEGEMAFTDKALAFGKTIYEGLKDLGNQGLEASEEAEGLLDFDAYSDIINIGSRDFWRFSKTIGGSIMDEIYGSSDSQELVREYMRYLDNFAYYQKVRPAMLASDEIEYKKLTDFGANFIDPFMAFPAAKVATFGAKTTLKGVQKGLTAGATLSRSQGMVNVAKGLRGTGKAVEKLERGVDIAGKIGAYPTEMASRMTAKALRKGVKGTALVAGIGLKGVGAIGSGTAKVASAPRKLIEAGVSKISKGAKDLGGVTLGGQVVGGITGSIPYAMELGITEGIGLIAKKIGKGAGEVLTTLAQPASNKRFLYRLATNSKVSPQTRKLAMHAYNLHGTAMGDAVFNMMANGLTIGAINAGLAGVAGENAENMGRAFGAGLLAGGIIPSGQQGMRAGKTDTARDMKSIDNHMKYKLTEEQRKAFKQMPKPAQVMLATLNESGIGSPKFMIMDSKPYLEMLNAQRREQGKPELTKAPRGHYDPVSRTFYANKSKLPESSAVAMETIAHETGHDFVYQMLGNDPMMLDLLLESYKTSKEEGTVFYYQFDKDGNPLGEPIYLNQMAVAIRDDYDMKQRGKPATAEDVAKGLAKREGEMIGGIKLGNNASKLAQEIGADQFAMMFSKDPNAFNHFHPRIRNTLIDASRKLLSVLGMAEPMTGNPLRNPISRIQLNNPALRRLYENYGRARAIELDEKGQLAKDGMLIRPKDGQTGEDRFMEMMGGNKEFQSNGLSLTEAKNLLITNKSLRREINNIKQRYKEEPQDGWSVKRGRLFGKRLTADLRTIFTRNDPFQNVATILDALQQAIDQGIGVVFGYRSGTKGKRQNPFKMRDVALYTWEVSANSLKVNGYNQAVIRHNIQVLVENGYIPKDGIKDFERQLAEQGQKALADPEGRINPDGGAENTLMTAVFGLKESAENIRSQGIKDLLESGKLKKAYVSYDVEALAGIGRGRRKAFTFNYDNIRNNYNPFRQSDEPMFMPDNDAPANLPPTPYENVRMSHRNRFTLGFNDNIIDEVVPSIKQDKFSGQQMIAAMSKTAGAKVYADEIGLTEFLNSKKSFEKSDVLKYMDENAPKLEVTRLKGDNDVEPFDHDHYRELLRDSELEQIGYEHTIEGNQFDDDGNEYFTVEYFGETIGDSDGEPMRFEDEYDAERYLEDLVNEYVDNYAEGDIEDIFHDAYQESLGGDPDADGATQYHEWAGDGGEDYQEVLVKLQNEGFDYDDPHFSGEENVIFHLRTKTRYDNEDNKVFFIEEVQSDLHQAGRSEGYDNAPLKGEIVERTYTPSPKITKTLNLTGGGEVKAPEVKSYDIHWEDGRVTRLNSASRTSAEIQLESMAKRMAGGVPDAPFKKNWPGLGLKLAIQEAMDNGATKVAWLGGQGHVDRYPAMTKHIRDIYVKYAHENRKLYDLEIQLHNGQTIKKVDLIERDMVRLVGKKFTQKAQEDLARVDDYKVAEANYVGLDLEIGKGGMLNFYDKELVSLANKIGKKIGAKRVERYKNNEGIEGWEMELPPRPVRVKSRNNYNEFSLFMPDTDKVSDSRPPELLKEMAKKPSLAPIIESEMRKPYLQKVQNTEKVRENEVSSRQREFDFTEGSFQEGVAKRLPNASESDVSLLTRLDEAQPVDFEKAFSKSDTISSIFKDKVEAPYNKPTSLVGKIVENPNDLAPLLTAFRHPYQEFLGCCVVDKSGKIQSANIITSGNIVSSIVPFQVILREAMRINDPTIYIWHNHPGGNPTPSAGDWGVTTKMGKLIKETSNITFGGHIVTNGDSFTFIDGDGATQTIELPVRDMAVWEKVARNDLYNLSDADVTAQVASNLRQSAPEDYIHGIFLNRKNRVVGIQRINRNVENLNEQLAMGAIDNGATAIIISENQPYKTKNDLFAQEARFRQFFATRGLDLLDYSLSNMPSFAGAGYETILNRDDQKMIFMPDGGGINRMPPTMPSSRFMRPAMTRTMATTEQLDRFVR